MAVWKATSSRIIFTSSVVVPWNYELQIWITECMSRWVGLGNIWESRNVYDFGIFGKCVVSIKCIYNPSKKKKNWLSWSYLHFASVLALFELPVIIMILEAHGLGRPMTHCTQCQYTPQHRTLFVPTPMVVRSNGQSSHRTIIYLPNPVLILTPKLWHCCGLPGWLFHLFPSVQSRVCLQLVMHCQCWGQLKDSTNKDWLKRTSCERFMRNVRFIVKGCRPARLSFTFRTSCKIWKGGYPYFL